VVLVAALVVFRMNQSDPTPAVQAPAGLVMGEMTGIVDRVDQTARTVEVSEAKGHYPVAMTVTDDTAITVRGEQRGLRDLKRDLPVRAFYEVRNDVKYVTRIQVVADEAEAKAGSPAESATAPAPSTRQSAAFKSTAPPAPAPAIATAPAPSPAPPAAAPAAPTVAPLVPPIAPAPPLTPVAEAPAPPRQTVSAGAPVAADAADGSEAVDWLLRNSRRR